jgi:uncharacterized membrane protein
VVRAGVPALLLTLAARGCRDAGREALAIELGSGLRQTASVSARKLEGAWQDCGYSRATGVYDCDGLATACDATTTLVNDAAPSWAFVTPAITASADTPGVEIRIRLRAHLSGRYEVATSEGSAELAVEGEAMRAIEREQIELADRGERAIEIRAKVPTTGWAFTMVRNDTIVPPRPFLDGPPDEPPAEVRAVH